jgi:hypothetical protein
MDSSILQSNYHTSESPVKLCDSPTLKTDNRIIEQLAQDGLRLASLNEAGWYWFYFDDNQERVTLWVTDLGGEA